MENLTNLIYDAVKAGKEIYIIPNSTTLPMMDVYEDDKYVNIHISSYFDLMAILRDCSTAYDVKYTFSLMYDNQDKEYYIYGFVTL